MAKDARPILLRYGSAVGLTALATVVRWVLTLLLGSTAPFAVFVMAVAVTALVGGLGPAMLTTIAGAFIALFVWLLPDHSIANFTTAMLSSLLVYLALCVFISVLIDLMRRAQRRAEENAHALNESRKLLSTTLGSIGDAVIATDMQGRVTFLNQVAESVTGWARRDAIDKPAGEIFTILNEQTRQPVESPVARVFRDGSIVGPSNHTVLVRKDGTEVLIDDSGAPIKNDQGELLGVVLVFRDITARRQSEEALRVSRERLDLILEASNIGFWYCDLPFRELIWDVRSKAHFGLPPDARASLRTFFDRLHPDDREPTRQAIEKAITEHKPYEVDYRTVGVDGRMRWVHAIGRTFYDKDGTPLRFDGITIDVTERKRSEEALRESQQRFRTMADSAPALIWMSGTDTLRSFFNKPWLDFTGRTMEQELGKGWTEDIHPDDFQRCLGIYISSFDARRSFKMEYRLRRFDGEYRWVLDHGVPLLTEAGEFKGYIGSCIDITERKEAEDALKLNRERLELVLETSDVGLWYCDLPFDELNWDTRVKAHFGLPPDAPVKIDTFYEQMHPDDREPTRQAIDRSIAEHSLYDVDYRTFNPDGSTRWVQAIGRTSYADDGTPLRFDGLTIDITERKLAEQARLLYLAEQQAHSERLQRLAKAAVAINSARSLNEVMEVITAQARVIIGAHQALASLVSDQNWAQATNVVSLSDKYAEWRDYTGPTDGSGIYAFVCETNQPMRMTQAELEASPAWSNFNESADKHPPLHGWLAAPLVGRDGRNLGLIQLSDKHEGEFTPEDESIIVQLAQMASVALENQRLIIAEQAARAEAEQGEQRARFLAEASAALASSLDYESTLTSVARLAVPQLADWCTVHIAEDGKNLKLLAMLHVDPEKVAQAQALASRYPLDPNAQAGSPNVLRTGKSEFYPEVGDAMFTRIARTPEHLRVLREGGMKSVMIVPLTARNRTLGVITFIISDSNRHYTETDLALAEDLARRAALAVDNALLFSEAHRARAQAEEANRMKDEFLATVSHELRTPLNAIVGWSHMLRTRSFDEATTARALETIERNAKSQAQIVEDILDVSRIITGKLRLDVQPVDLASVVDSALESVRPAAEAREIRLQSILDPRAGPVAGDPNRLQQIVWNLVANAVKFTSKNGRVQVRLERVNSHVEILVSDTGQGISSDLLPFIFDRFRQGDSTSTRVHGGLGLGLAIVRHLVELHGGTVIAESDGEGHGATFTVKLPLMALQTERGGAEREHPTSSIGQPPPEAPDLTGIRVLVVDDEADTREMLHTIIEQFGAQAKTCSSSVEALQVFQGWRPDVIVSDIEMPGEDGYQLMRQIRRLTPEQGGKIPAVALTAYARVDDRMRALSAGYQLHLAKPADPVELAMVIVSLATRSESA